MDRDGLWSGEILVEIWLGLEMLTSMLRDDEPLPHIPTKAGRILLIVNVSDGSHWLRDLRKVRYGIP